MEDWGHFAADSVALGHHVYNAHVAISLFERCIWEKKREQKWKWVMMKTDIKLPFSKTVVHIVVGHIPHSFSRTFYFFPRHRGSIGLM